MDYKIDIQSDDDFDCSNGYSDNFTSNNNSNSGYNTNGESHLANPNGLSKAELRKTNKPIMEKRRRARINHCLNELKSLILEAMKKDPARHTKLEKADILEMTVKHLQSVQRQQLNMAIQTDPSVVHKFKTGFVECAEEVHRYIGQLEGVDVGVRQRLSNHLKNCATSLEQLGSMTNFNNGYRGQLGTAGVSSLFGGALPNPLVPATVTAPNVIFPPPLPQDFNNNSNSGAPIQMGGVQLIPSRLPSGEFALIVPNASGASASSLLNNSPFANTAFAAWPHAATAAGGVSTPTNTTISTAQLSVNAAASDFITHDFQHTSAFSMPQQPKLTTITSNNNHTINARNCTTKATAVGGTFNPQPPTNNLHHNSTATTSPPLSPISSASSSSHGDDSIMHTSSDFATSRPATPPLDVGSSHHNFSGVFSTPSSAETSILSLSSRTSTHLQQQQVSSTSGSDLNTTGSSTSTTTTTPSLKRSLTETADSSDSSDEPSSKKFAVSQREKWENEEKEKGASLTKDLKYDRQQEKTKGALLIDERDSMWRPW